MKNLSQLASEQIQSARNRKRDEAANGRRSLLLVLSACATLLFFGLMAYAESSPLDTIETATVRIVLGVVIGVFAIGGGEFAFTVWHERLHHDTRINEAQSKIARRGLLLASVAAGLSTVSMIVYIFPGLIEGVLKSEHVAAVNLFMLAASLVGYFVLDGRYLAESDEAENNATIAEANNLAERSTARVVATIAAGRTSAANGLANAYDYREDALTILSDHLNRPIDEIQRLLPAQAVDPRPEDDAPADEWAQRLEHAGLSRDQLRDAIAYGESLRDRPTMTADERQPISVTGEEAERLARIAEGLTARPTVTRHHNGNGRGA